MPTTATRSFSYPALLLSLLVISMSANTAASDNLGLALGSNSQFVSDGTMGVFKILESEQGTDLNGDGDMTDRVLHVYDANTGTVENLGLAAYAAPHLVSYPLAAFQVVESEHGGDLNGDGNLDDNVTHIYNAATGQVINTGFSGNNPGRISSTMVTFGVSELDHGDLDGNGELSSDVTHVYDRVTDSIVNLESSFGVFATISDRYIPFLKETPSFERRLFLFDRVTNTVTNLGVYGALSGGGTINEFHDDLLVFLAYETNSGTDFNGDGDLNDNVAHLYDASTGNLSNLGVATTGGPGNLLIDPSGAFIGIIAWEPSQGADLNGDGDTSDQVLFMYETASGQLSNLSIAAAQPVINSFGLHFRVSESQQGNTDLNGDGDNFDIVLHSFDFASGSLVNLQRHAQSSLQVNGQLLAYKTHEGLLGEDLNGDGALLAEIPFVYDTGSGLIDHVPLAATNLILGDGFLALEPRESQESRDLNGDGDLSDAIWHVLDFTSGDLENLQIQGFEFGGFVLGQFLVIQAPEAFQGDLNGDGDAVDMVLFVYDNNSRMFFNLGAVAAGIGRFGRIPVYLVGNKLLYVRDEASAGQDLNGDGDLNDRVLQVFSPDVTAGSPEELILALIELVQSMGLHHGTENALLSKLGNALSSLQSGNSNSAANQLGAFVNQVEALSGMKLSIGQANVLLDAAQEIIDLL